MGAMKLSIPRRIVRTDTFRAVIILAGVLHICFLPCIWGNKSLMASAQDVPSIMPTGAFVGPPSAYLFGRELDIGPGGIQGEPWMLSTRYFYFHERTIPLWSPYQGYGRSYAANQLTQPFYPLTMALLLHISPRTYNWFILTRLFVAGMGAYLYLSFFVSFWPRIAGAVAAMLAGYYLLFLTATQISTEVLLPASLWAAEYLLRKRTYWSAAGFAIMLLIVFLGGMPESALLLFALLYAYILFRIASDATLRACWLVIITRLTAATCVGLALSLFYMLPFQELLKRSFDTHQAHNLGGALRGLTHETFGASIFTYFFPLLHGPPLAERGLRNYAALIVTLLSIIALAALFSKKLKNTGQLNTITWFFACSTILIVLKRYGLAINSLGALPFFQLIDFPKYEEALLSVCVAILAAIGVERLIRREISARAQAIAFAATALLIPAALWFSRQALRHDIVELHVPRRFLLVAILVPALTLAGAGITLVLFWKRRHVPLGMALSALIVFELSLNFIAPVYYWFYKLPLQTHNPYSGAPYIAAMKKEAGNYRIFARDNLLFPEWASAFQLYDIRDLDATYDNKYFPFVRNFFQDQKNLDLQYDLGDRFNGIGNYDITTPRVRRLLQLSSVKYIATMRPFISFNRLIGETLTQNQGHLLLGKEANIARRGFFLNAEARDELGEHPPYERLPYRIHVGNRQQEIFCFSYALDPFVYDKVGDGVAFTIETRDASGRITKQFSQYIDPKHNAGERRWFDSKIDLSTYRGQTIELLFTTTPGPKSDADYDWAAWSNFHFQGQDATEGPPPPPFKSIYNGEANVYRFDDVLPRAAIFYRAELVHNGDEALRKLADPSLDIFQSVVLDESTLDKAQRTHVAELNREEPVRVQAASIRSYKSRNVEIDASLNRSGILVLNDTDYPGWTVDVDGHRASWINANYLFRGVLLPVGKHTIQFAYNPQSFYLGAQISGATFAGLVVVGLAASIRRRIGTRTAQREAGVSS